MVSISDYCDVCFWIGFWRVSACGFGALSGVVLAFVSACREACCEVWFRCVVIFLVYAVLVGSRVHDHKCAGSVQVCLSVGMVCMCV